MRSSYSRTFLFASVSVCALFAVAHGAAAQTSSDPDLSVQVVATGLDQPVSMAFLGPNDFLVLEKATGLVKRVINGVVQTNPVLTVIVNSTSERGLLGIAINDETPQRRVFLYYTEAASPEGTVLGNRVYRYTWNQVAAQLQSPQLILSLPGTPGPNHDGGVIMLGPPGQAPGFGDGRLLYAIIGDLNRNGQLQNIAAGPAPDDTSVIFRVRQDGSAVPGNPFTPYCQLAPATTCTSNATCGANGPCNLQVARYYAYGIRNSFGINLDPVTGQLWETENGPANFDEVNRVPAGLNSGWNQIMGLDADDPQGTGNLFNMPGAGLTYSDPEITWVQTIAPTAIVFPVGSSLGPNYDDKAVVADNNFGQIYAIPLAAGRMAFDFTGLTGLADTRVDNQTERNLLRFAQGFGPITDLEIGPDGHLYAVDIAFGTIYRIVGPRVVSLPVPGLLPGGIVALSIVLGVVTALLLSRGRSARNAV
jgi:glucose/arabinose dehydrogenase